MTTTYPLPDEWFPQYGSEGWLFDEDRALRDHLKGCLVRDHEESARRVEVWFGHPDQEMREQKFPYITLDLLNVQEGGDRVSRGDLYIKDPPAWWGLEPLSGTDIGYLLEMPTPVDIDYQISTWSRNPRHDRQLLNQLINTNRLPLRGGLLFTADKKNRRLDVLAHFKRDTVESGKRLFNNIFRVRISSEVPWGAIGAFAQPPMPDENPPPPSGAVKFGPVTSVGIGLVGAIENLGLAVDRNTIDTGTVTAWNPDRTVDLDIKGETVAGVPISKAIYGDLAVDDVVAVSKHPKQQGATALADHHLLVLGLEERTKGEGE